MRRRHSTKAEPVTADIVAALAALEAEDLRQIILGILTEIDDRTHGQVVGSVIERATRKTSGWTPPSPSSAAVAEALAFAKAAKRKGHADPSDVDDYLQQGSNAFLARDYASALQIFAALLVPIGEVEIDLGQHEMIDEVLGSDVDKCALQYVVAVYMTTVPEQRAAAVSAALAAMDTVGYFSEPLAAMESVAVEALPDFDAFLSHWGTLLRQQVPAKRTGYWDASLHRWIREVTERRAGAAGLRELARSTKRPGDLDAWCRALATSGDWQAAMAAYTEAAGLVAPKDDARVEFLDGAALAAQELGRRDLPAKLERAWCQEPTMLRLRRWLGCAASKRVLRTRAAQALEGCPQREHRQRALLHVLLHDPVAAAELLAAAPGLGWSAGHHPGHLMLQLLPALLDGSPPTSASPLTRPSFRGMEIGEMELLTADDDSLHIRAPTVQELTELAGPARPPTAEAREAMLRALRKAAKKRLRGVTRHKRRRYYRHAAELVATCVALDPTPGTRRWLAGIRSDYGRYPALKRELDAQLEAI